MLHNLSAILFFILFGVFCILAIVFLLSLIAKPKEMLGALPVMVIFLGLVGLSGLVMAHLSMTLTPKQKGFSAFIGLDQSRYLDVMCEQKDVCKKYNRVRDECATAGNIDECINIKMKSQNYEMCQGTSDATLDGPEFPTSTQCFVNHISKVLKPGS